MQLRRDPYDPNIAPAGGWRGGGHDNAPAKPASRRRQRWAAVAKMSTKVLKPSSSSSGRGLRGGLGRLSRNASSDVPKGVKRQPRAAESGPAAAVEGTPDPPAPAPAKQLVSVFHHSPLARRSSCATVLTAGSGSVMGNGMSTIEEIGAPNRAYGEEFFGRQPSRRLAPPLAELGGGSTRSTTCSTAVVATEGAAAEPTTRGECHDGGGAKVRDGRGSAAPPLAEFHLKMGRAHFDRGDRDAARRCFRRVLAVHREEDQRWGGDGGAEVRYRNGNTKEQQRRLVIGAPHPEVVRATEMLARMAELDEAEEAAGRRRPDDGSGGGDLDLDGGTAAADGDSDATPRRRGSSSTGDDGTVSTWATDDIAESIKRMAQLDEAEAAQGRPCSGVSRVTDDIAECIKRMVDGRDMDGSSCSSRDAKPLTDVAVIGSIVIEAMKDAGVACNANKHEKDENFQSSSGIAVGDGALPQGAESPVSVADDISSARSSRASSRAESARRSPCAGEKSQTRGRHGSIAKCSPADFAAGGIFSRTESVNLTSPQGDYTQTLTKSIPERDPAALCAAKQRAGSADAGDADDFLAFKRMVQSSRRSSSHSSSLHQNSSRAQGSPPPRHQQRHVPPPPLTTPSSLRPTDPNDFLAFTRMARSSPRLLSAHQESPQTQEQRRLQRQRQQVPPPPLTPSAALPDPTRGVSPDEDERSRSVGRPKAPRSILIRKGSGSVMSDMIESTATSWAEKQAAQGTGSVCQSQHSRPSVGSRSRVSWADQKKGGQEGALSLAGQGDGDAANIPPGQLVPEITFHKDQSHTVNLKAATATKQTLAQHRHAAD